MSNLYHQRESLKSARCPHILCQYGLLHLCCSFDLLLSVTARQKNKLQTLTRDVRRSSFWRRTLLMRVDLRWYVLQNDVTPSVPTVFVRVSEAERRGIQVDLCTWFHKAVCDGCLLFDVFMHCRPGRLTLGRDMCFVHRTTRSQRFKRSPLMTLSRSNER